MRSQAGLAKQEELLATHAKARALFLDACKGITVLAPSGGTDPVAEAKAYEAGLLALSGRLPFGANGVPVCDLMVLGGACPRNGYRGPSARPC